MGRAHQRASIEQYTRKRPLKEGRQTRGHAGLFKQFLEANNRKYGLKLEQLIKKGGSSGVTSARPSYKDVVKGFRNYCFSQGMSRSDYPFNTASQGRRSIERFAKEYLAATPSAAEVWFGKDAADKHNIGTGEKSFPFANAPFDIVGMDTHTMHCVGTLIIEGSHGPQEIAIERIDLHVLVDYFAKAILGYSVSIASQISGLTIEKALLCWVTPWKPREIGIEGLNYIPGAALPVGNIPGLDEIRPCAIWADNGSAHFANRLTQTARMQLGCALTYIPVGAWWVEALGQAASNLGLDAWAVAHRLDELETDVSHAFMGGDCFTVALLVRVADTLGMAVDLRPAAPALRRIGVVPTVVDQVVQRLAPHLVEPPEGTGAEASARSAPRNGSDASD